MGLFYDGIGVVIAWVFSLALGSSIIYLSYHVRHKIALIELLPKASRIMTVACLVGILSAFIINYKLAHILNPVILSGTILLSFLVIIVVPFWLHPMRKRLMGWVTNELLNKTSGVR